MNVNELKVIISYSIPGAIRNKGRYNYVEKTNQGNLLPEKKRLRTLRPVEYHKCTKTITLGTEFIKHAISNDSRPSRRDNDHVNLYWKTMSWEDKLYYHVHKYVMDMYGRLESYSLI
jgi:hypothetical protein